MTYLPAIHPMAGRNFNPKEEDLVKITEELYRSTQPLKLESGRELTEYHLHYTTFGKLNPERNNVVWVCHALTGNSNPSEWWPGLFGPGKVYDPEKFFVICANMLGSCYGSTNALDKNPATAKPYFHDFPTPTNRDIVGAFIQLRKSLGFEKVHTLIGGSMGGQQALEWAIIEPEVFENLIGVSTNAHHSPWGIAFNESQRMAIVNDATFKESKPDAGLEGMKTARTIALLSYRHYLTYQRTQEEDTTEKTDDYLASSYQQYQGEKLKKRFNAYSYWRLSKAMDSHNVGRGRGSIEKALSQIKANSHFVGIRSDILFPIDEQVFLASHVGEASLDIIDSLYGHDGFLIEWEAIAASIEKFYKRVMVAV
jgi:homoserine O-acetyltransferase/O-succinyltransferase